MTRVLVTGAKGFVGRAVCRRLQAARFDVVAAVRDDKATVEADETRYLGDLTKSEDFDRHLSGCDVVVHLAARVHVMNDPSTDPDVLYSEMNVAVTKRLAEAALRLGIKRFVFLSSIKVNGDETTLAPFTEADPPNPQDAYGRSKQAAEQILMGMATQTALEPVILRVPLVYGPDVKANFLSLLKLCDSSMPLPFGAISENRRSLIYVENLADAIATAIDHPNAGGQIFLVSDGPPVSTASLVAAIRAAFGRPNGLIPVPPGFLRFLLSLIGKSATTDRLTGSLEIDDSLIRQKLGWTPPATFKEGLAATIGWYRDTR
ncbi:MAG: SDR family oxidoreductase [Rhodospirillaceae bacterium]|jgi:nucleoside-diphosphate-sugar epimerase|nr:SDR family oxidoreductase [Rhodospirillaceae bacterium]MBT5457995.1 SDR family oxidoreductase [Rhodospirillaceae bacterium]